MLAARRVLAETEREQAITQLNKSFGPDAETDAKDIATFITNIESAIKNIESAIETLKDIDRLEERGDLNPEPLDLVGDIPHREWLIRDWLPANCLSMITGKGGVGKSYAALQIAAALTNGVTDDLIFKSTSKAKLDAARGIKTVVYAAWEDDADEIRRRLKLQIKPKLKWVELDPIADRFTFIDMKGHGPIWGPEFQSHIQTRANMLTPGHQLTRICEDKGASLLILDPGAGAFGGNENDRAAVREYTAFLNHWGNEHNCATLILAHPPKSGDSYSGSTDWLGSVRSMWEIGLRPDTEKKGTKTTDTEKKGTKTTDTEKEDTKTIEYRYYSIQHTKSNYALEQSERFMRKAENSGVWIEVDSRDAANLNTQNSTQEDTEEDEPDIY